MAQEIFKQYRTGNIFSDTYLVKNGGRHKELRIKECWEFVIWGAGCVPLSKTILRDLDRFEDYLNERGQIDFKNLSPQIIRSKVAKLEQEFGPYGVH